MDMVLNTLPGRTWNRLGLNESFVTIQDSLIDHTPDANGETAFFTPDSGLDFPEMDTGMGKDVFALTENARVSAVHTAAGEAMSAPVVLTYNYDEGEKAASRLLLHAEKGSRQSVVLLLTSKGNSGISALRTEIIAEEDSHIELCVAQILGGEFLCLNDIGGVCRDNASIHLTKLELGSTKVYTGTAIDLVGAKSAFTTDIGYQVVRGQLLDMNYVANHRAAHSNSYMEVTGTLENGGKKVFRGTIDFKRGCPGSKGTESENVLLMGDDVVNQSIPLILCKEEDVEGNHGASIGKLDEKMLFYLSTRGISEDAAQRIIADARIESLCEKIPDESVQEAVHLFQEKRSDSYDHGN